MSSDIKKPFDPPGRGFFVLRLYSDTGFAYYEISFFCFTLHVESSSFSIHNFDFIHAFAVVA